MKMASDHHPQTGQMAIMRLMMLTSPTTAPMDTSLGLYYSTLVMPPDMRGMIKEVKSMRQTIRVYPVMLISKKRGLMLGLWKR
jgi:hypothetical protein